MRLSAEEARVLGSLMEKELATPQQYPLTMTSLVAACNQATNRDPVVDYDEDFVGSVLDDLKAQRLVRFVLPSHGRSALRYRHVLDEVLALDPRQRALLAVLLLRGPQTIGELRTRTDRMAQFDGLNEIEHELEYLASLSDPVVVRLTRRPGQKEERWMCSLTGPPAGDALPGEQDSRDSSDSRVREDSDDTDEVTGARPSFQERLDGLLAELAIVRSEVNGLRRDLDELRANLGG